MHVRWAVTLMAMVACCAGVAQAEPSGGDLIAKYFEASGGKDKMAAVKSRVDTGTFMLVDMGMEATYSNTVAPPNSLMALDFDGTIVQNGVTDGVAWSVNPFQGNSKTEGASDSTIFPFLALADAGPVAKVAGEEEVEDAACHKVEVAGPDGSLTVWFDKETGLISKSVDDSGSTTLFSDYKEAGGLTVPHKIVQSGGEFNLEMTLTKVEIDAKMEDGTFDIPEEVN